MSVPKKLGPRTHVDVNDRRLKPIYESLDNGDNKKAIQEAERVLKKAKQLICAKALKCLALIRLGRKTEAKSILSEIRKTTTLDEGTMQALTACYKELPDFEQIVHMYEESLALNPNDEATLTQLFNAYVRIGDSRNQQQVAMKLYKLFPSKTPYLFWVIMSYVMMSSQDSKAGKKLYLPLAEGMTLKYLKESKHDSEAEVMLYVLILEKQKKYKELLEILRGLLGEKIVHNIKYKELLLLKVLANLEDWKELNKTYKSLLLRNLDDIVWYREYLKFAAILLGNPPSDSSLSALSFQSVTDDNNLKQLEDISIVEDDSLDSMAAFLSSCIELSKVTEDGYALRAPYLARLEMIAMFKDESSPSWKDNLAPQYLKLMADYFDRFGDKPCCFSDLRKFFDVLNHEEKIELREMFKDPVTNADGTFNLPENCRTTQRHVFILQANHYMGFYEELPTKEQLSLVGTLLSFYQHALMFGEHLKSTEIQPADPYILLSAEILFTVAKKTDDMLQLVRAVALLEDALEKSPSNFFTKLLLVKYHATLGTMSHGFRIFELLEVKYIQNDTMGYIISNPLMKFGQFHLAKKYCDTTLKFYESVQRESTDYIINCYKYGTFDRIKEFVDLKRRVSRSVQFAGISINKLMLGLIAACYDHKAVEELVFSCNLEDFTFYGMGLEKLLDNRDFHVSTNWKLYGRQKEGFQEKSFEEEKTWILLQTLTLRMLWRIVKESNVIGLQQANVNASNDLSLDDPHCADKRNFSSLEISRPSNVVPPKVIENFACDSSSDVEDEISNHFASCSLFEKDDERLSIFKSASARAKELMNGPRETFAEHFFQTPLKVFIDKKLDESFAQFVRFFDSVVEVIKNPGSDKNYIPLDKATDILAFEFSVKNVVSDDDGRFSFKEVACLEEAVLLLQHLCQLVIIFNCCDQLLQPFRTKKGKKKAKKLPEIPNISLSYNLLAQGLVSLHSMLTAFFKKTSETFLPNVSAMIDHIDKTSSTDSLKILSAARKGFDNLRNDSSELLQHVGVLMDRLKDKEQNESL